MKYVVVLAEENDDLQTDRKRMMVSSCNSPPTFTRNAVQAERRDYAMPAGFSHCDAPVWVL
jgi:hypothetical protein